MLERNVVRGVRSDDGMSLVEVVVAMVVLAIVATAAIGVILRAESTGVNNRSRIAAANLAAREIDILRERFGRTSTAPVEIYDEGVVVNQNPIDPTAAVGDPLVVDGMRYTVTRSSTWDILGNGESACSGGLMVKYPALSVTVSVTWPGMGTTQPVVSYAKLTPTKGNGVPGTTSFIAVGVVDSAGQPLAGQPVQVTGPSESVPGTTDPSGCAVVQVSPSAAGTTYTARLANTGYVDVNNDPNPSKTVGLLLQGQLNNSVTFAYDRAASLRVRVVDTSGNQVPDTVASGSQVTVAGVGTTGALVTRTMTLSSAVTDLTGLWPTTYGAFYGATPPAGGYPTVALPPGGNATLDVPLTLASSALSDMPAGTTVVKAVPTGQPCTSPSAVSVAPAGFSLIPGAYDFYASAPGFTCSPGPTAVALASGPNDGILWGATTLSVTGAPTTGVLWAVDASVAGPSLTTCPTPAQAATAINVDTARTAPVALAAGSWYVYRTDGAATGTCLSVPSGRYPVAGLYGASNTLAWVEPAGSATLKVTKVDAGRVLVLSTATISCTNGVGWSSSGIAQTSGSTTANGQTLSLTVTRPSSGQAVWNALIYRPSKKECTPTGSFKVGTATTSLSKASGTTNQVGP